MTPAWQPRTSRPAAAPTSMGAATCAEARQLGSRSRSHCLSSKRVSEPQGGEPLMSVLRRYYRGDELVAMRDVPAATTRYYHFDHQGTTQCLTDSTGAVTDRFASEAWGAQVKRTGSSIDRHWYVGGKGYYDTCTARRTTETPVPHPGT